MTITVSILLLVVINLLINGVLVAYLFSQKNMEPKSKIEMVILVIQILVNLLFLWEVTIALYIFFKILEVTQLEFYWDYFKHGYVYKDYDDIKNLMTINALFHFYRMKEKLSWIGRLKRMHVAYTLKLVNRSNNYTPVDLTLISVIGFEEFPCTYLYEDKEGKIIIKEWADVIDDNVDRYYYYEINPSLFDDYLNSQISHRDMIKAAENERICFVDELKGNPINNFIVSSDEMPDEYLPKEDVMFSNFRMKEDMKADIIKLINAKIYNVK